MAIFPYINLFFSFSFFLWKVWYLYCRALELKWVFCCRYSPHERRTTEENIQWDRLRAPPVDTPPHILHASDCLNDLKPGNHIEIQWRRKREFPYGVFLNQYAFMIFFFFFTCNSNSIGMWHGVSFIYKISCVFFFESKSI
jgi:hypothetical protein